MKKLLIILLAVTLVLCVSCSKPAPDETTGEDDRDIEVSLPADAGETADDADGADAPDVNGENGDDGDSLLTAAPVNYTVRLSDGREIVLGSAAAPVIEALGEYTDMYEAPSCVHDGFDRVYSYGSFSVTTSPDENGDDIVNEFAIETPGCALDGGLTVGSTTEDMETVFGTDYEESFGFIRYSFSGADASFVTSDGTVSSILFTYTGK